MMNTTNRRSPSTPIYTVVLEQAAPCDGCEFWLKCKYDLLACRAFSAFVNEGKTRSRNIHRQYDDIPKRYIYERIFRDEDTI